MIANGPVLRLLPRLDDTNRSFWTGGESGRLVLQRCQACHRFIHPPGPICPYCLSPDLTAEAVSGRATLTSFTVNHQEWIPGSDPYVVGLVTLIEQDDIRLTTNVVAAEPEALQIGMAMEVTFEQADDVYLPLFRPAGTRS